MNKIDNKLYNKQKNPRINTPKLCKNKSEIVLTNSIKINKGLTDRKIIDKDNLELNTTRNNNVYNSDQNSKNIMIPKKRNDKDNYTKKMLPLISENNSIVHNSKNNPLGIYMKPTGLARSKSIKKKSHTNIKTKFKYINKKRNIISTNKKPKDLSINLKNKKYLYSSPNHTIQNDDNRSLKLKSAELKPHKSACFYYESSIENISTIKKGRKKLNFDKLLDTSQKKNIVMKTLKKNNNNCFYYKFYKYFIKQPKINKCYFTKKYIDKNSKNEQNITLKIPNKNKNIDNNTITLSLKDEIMTNDNNKIFSFSNKILNNEEEKINESSQNGLTMTFGEVNYTKKNSEKMNTINIKNSDLMSQLNNDIINDESFKSEIDMYKKLNILPETKKIIEDNISENEDIQFNFSDEEGGTGSIFPSQLQNSNKNNNTHQLKSNTGKEFNDIDTKKCKTFKKVNDGMKYNLEKAEKGLRILKKIAVRRGYKSDDENFSKLKNQKNDEDTDKNRYHIYLGTNKLNDLFNSRQESKSSLHKKNNSSYDIKYKNTFSKSVNKDILKGISKIEYLFEKKNLNDNRIKTYNRKHKKKDNIDSNISDDFDLKEKLRNFIQNGKNNLYFSLSKTGKESTNTNDYNTKDDDNMYDDNHTKALINEDNNNNIDLNNNCDKNKKKLNKDKYNIDVNYISNKNDENQKTIKNMNFSIKEILLKEFKKDTIKNKEGANKIIPDLNELNIKEEKNNDNKKNKKDLKTLKIKKRDGEKKNSELSESNDYLFMINKSQSKNSVKHNIIFLLNIITDENYSNIINQITDIILYKNNKNSDNINNKLLSRNLNEKEILLKNEHIFKDIIIKKATTENKYLLLYVKICNDLNNNISNALIEQKNIRNNKERNLKFIINEECILLINKYKKISKEYNNITNKENNDYIQLRTTVIEYVNFVYELINFDLIKQQFGFYIIEQFYKKYIDNEVKNIFKALYLEACITLLNKLGKNIIEKNNKKLIQNINSFISNNLSPLINDNNETNIPSSLKYKIINVIKKNKNSWKESLFEIYQKNKNIFELKEKEESDIKKNNEEEIVSNNNKQGSNIIINEKKGKKKTNDYTIIIEDDLKNYISYFTEQGNKGQINIKTKIDKSYNWKVIDDLVNDKKYGLEYIIIQFIHICSNIINDENQLFLSNDYIKNIIEFYSNNFTKASLDLIHNEMIKIFLEIDEIIKINHYMSKILGNLLFVLIENRLYHIKDFNNYLKVETQTQINLAIITKYCIISSGKFAKKYFNDFKQTKLFLNNYIFKQYVTDALKDLFYFIK